MTGAKPIFVDVNEQTFVIDLLRVKGSVTPKTKAVIGVHLFSQSFDVPGIRLRYSSDVSFDIVCCWCSMKFIHPTT